MPNAVDTYNYRALVQERADLIAEAKAVFESAATRPDGDRGLTDEEKERDDAIHVQVEKLTEDITRVEAMRDLERNVSPAQPDPKPEPEPVGRGAIYTRPNTPSGGPFATFGHQLQAMADAAAGNVEAREKLVSVVNFHEQYFQAAAQGAGIAIDSDGGFLVQTDFASEILRKMHDVGNLLSMVRRIPLDADANGIKLPMIDESSRADGSRLGGIRGYWLSLIHISEPTRPY